jgi:S-adenosylmethionine:tRNA ribosyltransferase-isomerase
MSSKRRYTLSDFSFELPEELIAQFPVKKREESRLMILNRESGECEHRVFRQIDEYLREGDLLVLNDARVIPARIFFRRETGGLIEIILIRQFDERSWLALTNKTRRLRESEVLKAILNPSVEIEIVERMAEGILIRTNTTFDFDIRCHPI